MLQCLSIDNNKGILLNKMEDTIGFKWTCPQFKVFAPVLPASVQPAATIQDMTKVDFQAMSSLQASLGKYNCAI